jgi:hypothetical protein
VNTTCSFAGVSWAKIALVFGQMNKAFCDALHPLINIQGGPSKGQLHNPNQFLHVSTNSMQLKSIISPYCSFPQHLQQAPTPVFRDQPPTTICPLQNLNRTASVDSEFGAFISVPAAQDPLSFDFLVAEPAASTMKFQGLAITGNASLHYFDQFTSSVKTASDQNRRVEA